LAGRITAILALALASLACGERTSAPPASVSAAGGYDGGRAYRDLETLAKLGPRPAGSAASAKARALIEERLRQAGWVVEEQPFQVTSAGRAPVDMVNVVGHRDGASEARLLLVTHYDTKNMAGIEFIGANDGASGTAVLLELARALGSTSLGLRTELLFCDGEEAFGANINADDGLYGSKHLAAAMADAKTLDSVRALVLVDMVGDRDLNLAYDLGSSSALRDGFEREARKLGWVAPFDLAQVMHVIDDHTPFQDRGVREVLALIDFQYGSRRSPGPLWHTAGDRLEAVSAESLNTVGKPLVEFIRDLASQGGGPSSAPH
jgi:glutaminyl-peptide cyclotransferase